VICLSELVLVKSDNFEGLQCDIYKNDKEYFMTREQIGTALGYSDPRKAISNIHTRHKDRLNQYSSALKLRTDDDTSREVILYNRKGIMEICRWSEQLKADKFIDWVWDVMDSLISGQYAQTIQASKNEQMNIESRMLNSQVKQARELETLANKYGGTDYSKILDSYASKALVGEHIIPLPELPERTYTATEIGNKLGITAKKVGMLTNEHNLKTKEYGMWFRDVALHRQDMEVPAFRYFENIIPVLKKLRYYSPHLPLTKKQLEKFVEI